MEEWRDLVYPTLDDDFNWYEISSFGNLRNKRTGKILKPNKLSSGYLSAKVYGGYDAFDRQLGFHIIIHKAVAYTFLPNPDNLPEVDHRDNNKTNNHVDNLKWVTSHENQKRKYDTGAFDKRKISGENNHAHKLTWDEVRFIRKSFILGDSEFGYKGLARRFGVSTPVVRSIIEYRTWKEQPE